MPDGELEYQKPYGFIKVTNCPFSYGFIIGQYTFKFYNGHTGKIIELEGLHLELPNLTAEERLSFWKYVLSRDLYLELAKDPRLKHLPMSVRMHVANTYKF